VVSFLRFPQQNSEYYSLLLFSHLCATRSAHLDLLHLIAQTISGEQRRSWSFSYCCVRHSQSQPLSATCSRTVSVQVVTLAVTELVTSRSSTFRLHLRSIDWQYSRSAAGAQRALSHVRHAIPTVPRLELLRPKPDNIFCSASIQSLPARKHAVCLSVCLLCFDRRFIFSYGLFNDAGTVPRLRRSVAGLSPRKLGFEIRPVCVGFVVGTLALRQVFLRLLRFYPVRVVGMRHRRFPTTSRLSLGPTQPPIRWVLGSFPGNKAAGASIWRSTPSSAEVKNEWSYTSSPPTFYLAVSLRQFHHHLYHLSSSQRRYTTRTKCNDTVSSSDCRLYSGVWIVCGKGVEGGGGALFQGYVPAFVWSA